MGKRLRADERTLAALTETIARILPAPGAARARLFRALRAAESEIAPVGSGAAPPKEEPAPGGRFQKHKLIGARGRCQAEPTASRNGPGAGRGVREAGTGAAA
jgi:hypothetical protein